MSQLFQCCNLIASNNLLPPLLIALEGLEKMTGCRPHNHGGFHRVRLNFTLATFEMRLPLTLIEYQYRVI